MSDNDLNKKEVKKIDKRDDIQCKNKNNVKV